MGGGGAGLRGKQTPHVAAPGRGPRAGGGAGRGGGGGGQLLRPPTAPGAAAGPPRCLPGRTRSCRCRCARAAVRGSARDRRASAAPSAHPGTAAPHCAVPLSALPVPGAAAQRRSVRLSAHLVARYRCSAPPGAAVGASRYSAAAGAGAQPARPAAPHRPVPLSARSGARCRRRDPPVPLRSRSFSCSAAPRPPGTAERLHRTPGAGPGAAPRPRSSAPPQYPRRGHRSGGTDLCCRYLGRPSPNRAAQRRTGPDRAAQCRPVAPLCAPPPPPRPPPAAAAHWAARGAAASPM